MEAGQAVKKRGRPPGTPGGGRYGCTTKVVRVPVDVADNIVEILAAFEDIKQLVDDWQEECQESVNRSSRGVISPRYEKARVLLNELRSCLGE